jgi:type IV pilus assembly protein PilQ
MKIKCPTLRFGWLLLVGAAVSALPANAQVTQEIATSTASLSASTSISNVDVSRTGQQTAVRISGTQELHYRTFRLDDPPRLVLDFANARSGVAHNTVPSDFAPVRGVRIGQPNPGQTRVVIDLATVAAFHAQADGSNLTVSFTDDSISKIPVAIHPVTKRHLTQKVASIQAPEMPLPAWLTGNSLALGRPAAEPPAPEVQGAPAPSAPPLPAVPQSSANASSDKKYTGDPISVNLKDVDLKDFFRLIHEISGLNVVLDPAVKGTVTLVLDDVPWDQGLEIVLRNNSLAKEIDGNVLRIVTQDTLKHEAEQRRDLLKAQTESIEPVTVTRVLSYAQANLVLATTLKKFLTARGDITPDVRSNTLIIRDIPSSIPKIDDLIRQLDKKSQQVEIDARVVQASRSFARELGTQLAYSFGAGNNVFGGNQAVGTSPISRPFIPGISTSPALIAGTPPLPPASGAATASNVAMPLATNLAATAATSGLTYLFTSTNFALDFMLTAMENRGVGKILSEPKGVTQNNQKLTVKQGTKIPIQTNVNNTVSVQYIDAVLKLEVTPQITAEGTVFLDVTVENTQIDQGIPLIQGTPALDTQSTETKVLINDGGTVVIGGVVISNQTTSVDQVPLLGSMPLIGNLFKHTTIKVSTQELMFFVTPRIMPG